MTLKEERQFPPRAEVFFFFFSRRGRKIGTTTKEVAYKKNGNITVQGEK